MGYAVHGTCLEDIPSANRVYCAQFSSEPQINSDGSYFLLSCNIQATDGAIRITRTYVSPTGTVSNYNTYPSLFYPPCVDNQYVDASLQIFAAILASWATWYCVAWLYRWFDNYIHWSRGDDK